MLRWSISSKDITEKILISTQSIQYAGKRDPNAKGVEGISGTKLRELAKTGKLDVFKQALASKLSDREKTAIYNQIRKVYSISDDVMFDRDELREAYLMGEFFNVGDIVYDMNEETEYEIIEQGPNFVYCQGEDGNVYTKWLSDYPRRKRKMTKIDPLSDKTKISKISPVLNQQNTIRESSPSLPNLLEMHISRKVQRNQMTTQVLTNQHLEMLQQKQSLQSTRRNSSKCLEKYLQMKKIIRE